MKKIYVIRHTTPAIDKGFCYGKTDLALRNTFTQEAEAISEVLVEGANNIPLWSSPLQRCLLLAQKLNPEAVQIDERLQEMNFGEWEMRRWDEIPEHDLMPWRGNFVNIRTPQGESYLDVRERALAAWYDIVGKAPDVLGIVTHYGVMQSLLAELLHIPFEKAFRLQLDYGNVFVVTIHNDNIRLKFLK